MVNIESLVSVIIPTYKRPPVRIERSIKSVLNQTYQNIELIVVDDSPREYSDRMAVKEFIEGLQDSRVRYIQHEKNLGANIARNTGIDHSNGKYCAFLDDDDEWLAGKIEKQVAKLENSSVALVYCKASVTNEIDGSTREVLNELKSGFQFENLLKQNFIGSNSYVLIDKKVLDEVGRYDEQLLSNQDYDLFLRIAEKYEIDFVNEILVNYYIHDGERISTSPTKLLKGRVDLYEKYKEYIERDKELSQIWRIKLVPILFKNDYKLKGAINLFILFLQHPYFVVKYLRSTIKYRKKKTYNLQKE